MVSCKKIFWDNGQKWSWGISYKDHEGKWQKKQGFKTKIEAELWYKNFEDLQKNSQKTNTKLLFKVACDDFLTLHAKVHCKESTYVFYECYLRKHIIPLLGDFNINNIKPDPINEFISIKQDEKYSPKTINHMLTIIESVFNYLISNDKTDYNPVNKIKRLKLDHREVEFLTIEEIKKFLAICKKEDPKYFALFATAIFTGLRQGELLALTWDDTIFTRKQLRINKSIHRKIVTTPKTSKSIRNVDIPNNLIKILKEHFLMCYKSDSNLVFANKEGHYMCPRNLVQRHFEPLLRKAGLPQIRFHDLRHTYSALLIAENVPIKYIQSQLGHSSIDITMDTYGHLLPNIARDAVNKLDCILENNKEKVFKNGKINGF